MISDGIPLFSYERMGDLRCIPTTSRVIRRFLSPNWFCGVPLLAGSLVVYTTSSVVA